MKSFGARLARIALAAMIQAGCGDAPHGPGIDETGTGADTGADTEESSGSGGSHLLWNFEAGLFWAFDDRSKVGGTFTYYRASTDFDGSGSRATESDDVTATLSEFGVQYQYQF